MEISKPILNSIIVTAKCTANPGLQYWGFDTLSKILVFKKSFMAGTADMGNFLAIVHAMQLLKRNNIEIEAIYSISPEAVLWVNEKECKNGPRKGAKREAVSNAIRDAERWLTENSSKTKILEWNEEAWGEINEMSFLPSVSASV